MHVIIYSKGVLGRSSTLRDVITAALLKSDLSMWPLLTFDLCWRCCVSRCVEIIAKEGRSLKELYLVSCKITDHGKTDAFRLKHDDFRSPTPWTLTFLSQCSLQGLLLSYYSEDGIIVQYSYSHYFILFFKIPKRCLSCWKCFQCIYLFKVFILSKQRSSFN